MTTDTDTAPRIYVACLASYNAGRLVGRWIDAAQDADDLADEIREMLADSPIPNAEEWAVHDHEGFGPYRLGEYPNLEDVATLAQGIEEHGEPFAMYCANVGAIVDADEFAEAYCGEWDSGEDYAREFLADTGADIPDWLTGYVDYSAIWHDWTCEGFYIEKGHIFRPV